MVLPDYAGSSRYALINTVCIALANHDQPSQAVHNELTLLSGLIRTARCHYMLTRTRSLPISIRCIGGLQGMHQ